MASSTAAECGRASSAPQSSHGIDIGLARSRRALALAVHDFSNPSAVALPRVCTSRLRLPRAIRLMRASLWRRIPIGVALSQCCWRGRAPRLYAVAGCDERRSRRSERIVIPAKGVESRRTDINFTPLRAAMYDLPCNRLLANGGEVSSRDFPGKALMGGGHKLAIDLSAASLPDGDYIIVVRGGLGAGRYEDLESYFFHVVRARRTL